MFTYWASWSHSLQPDIGVREPIVRKQGNLRLLVVRSKLGRPEIEVLLSRQNRFQIHFGGFDELEQGKTLIILAVKQFKGGETQCERIARLWYEKEWYIKWKIKTFQI